MKKMIHKWIVIVGLVTAMLCTGVQAATPGPEGQPSGPWRDQIHWIPMRDAIGFSHLLYTRICRPPRDVPARVVLINHGSPADPNGRPTMRPSSCESEAMQWFLSRGYITVAAMRRGYSETGGVWAENYGTCSADGYANAGRESARDLDAVVNYATALPYARPDGVVVVGQSVGGWVTDAYNSLPHPKVVAFVSMAGGHGGHHDHNLPNTNCRADELARAAGIYGATATTPMLWVYTANDSFFAPEI